MRPIAGYAQTRPTPTNAPTPTASATTPRFQGPLSTAPRPPGASIAPLSPTTTGGPGSFAPRAPAPSASGPQGRAPAKPTPAQSPSLQQQHVSQQQTPASVHSSHANSPIAPVSVAQPQTPQTPATPQSQHYIHNTNNQFQQQQQQQQHQQPSQVQTPVSPHHQQQQPQQQQPQQQQQQQQSFQSTPSTATSPLPQQSPQQQQAVQLQGDNITLQRTILQLQTDISVEQTKNLRLAQENHALQARCQELERYVLHERRLRLEVEQTLDRLGMRNHHQTNTQLRRASSSLSEAPPPPPPTRQAPSNNAADPNQTQYKSKAQTPVDSHDGQTIRAQPSTNRAPLSNTNSNNNDDEQEDPFDAPAPALAFDTFAPPSASNDQRDTRLDSRRAITTNARVDQQQALSPLEDDWTFDSSNTGFMHQHEMSLLIQATLERWSQEFGFSKDVRDFMLMEISDIVEGAASEQLMKKQLERYHYELMTSPYQLVRKIGAGGFGSVYQGVDKSTMMPVAIKVISLEDTEDDVMVITREITALVQGHSCPQLIRYFGSDVKSTKLWIVMEYVNGGSLLDHIKIEPLSEKYIAIVAREVLLGLQYLNNEGKIHRDIKAANILIGTEGSVKLADFGASRALNDTMSKCNTFVGSPYWMSPDVITQHDYDGKADIWSLGITCIELAQGKPPHTNVNPMAVLQVIIRDPPPLLHGNFSKDFKDFVALCLIKDPHQRPGVQELLKSKFIKNAKKTKIISELFGGEEQ